MISHLPTYRFAPTQILYFALSQLRFAQAPTLFALCLLSNSLWDDSNVVLSFSFSPGSGGNVVDNTLDYQSSDRNIDPPLLRTFGWDVKLRSRLCMTSLLVGSNTRVNSCTHVLHQNNHSIVPLSALWCADAITALWPCEYRVASTVIVLCNRYIFGGDLLLATLAVKAKSTKIKIRQYYMKSLIEAQIKDTMYSLKEKNKKKNLQIYIKLSILSGAMEYLLQKCHFIEPQKFDTADFKCFTIFCICLLHFALAFTLYSALGNLQTSCFFY